MNDPDRFSPRTRTTRLAHRTTVALAVAFAAAVLVIPSSLAAQSNGDPHPLAGEWHGTLSAGGQSLRLIVNVSVSDTGIPSAVMTSVDQGNAEVPVDVISLVGDTVEFSIAQVDGSYQGVLAADEGSIEGEWTQLGSTLPLVLERARGA